MAENKPFWTTLPGILTGIAALITAIVTAIQTFSPHGLNWDNTHPATNKVGENIEESVPPVTQIEPQTSEADAKLGDQVLSAYKHDKCFYPGTVTDRNEVQYKILYESGAEGWVGKTSILFPRSVAPSDLRVGSNVVVKMDSVHSAWAPGVVEDIRDDQYYVALQEGASCAKGRSYVWATMENVILSSQRK